MQIVVWSEKKFGIAAIVDEEAKMQQQQQQMTGTSSASTTTAVAAAVPVPLLQLLPILTIHWTHPT